MAYADSISFANNTQTASVPPGPPFRICASEGGMINHPRKRLSDLQVMAYVNNSEYSQPAFFPPVATARGRVPCLNKIADLVVVLTLRISTSLLPFPQVLLLENVRFYKEEEKNDPEHAKALGKGIDYFVNDAFGTAHRAHASTAGIANYVTRSIAGFLLEKELAYLEGAVTAPKRPFVAIVSSRFDPFCN